MALNYTAVAGDGIFDVLGKLFAAAGAVNTARGATVPTSVAALSNQFKKDAAATNAMNAAFSDLPQGQTSWQAQGDAFLSGLSNEASAYLRAVCLRDSVQPADTINNALSYLIRNMLADGAYVEFPVVDLALQASLINSPTDLTILYSFHRGDGQHQQNMLAETINVSLTSVSVGASVKFLTSLKVGNLSQDWPMGSGVNRQLTATNPDASLLTNGNLDTVTVENIPDDFQLLDGMPGTDYTITGYEVQQIVVSGPPTAGGYYIRFAHPNGSTYISPRLAFDAAGGTVQTALRTLPGLDTVTVVTTGDSPLYTHEITFTGIAGDLSALTIDNQTSGGGFAISEVTPGDTNAFRGRTLHIVGSSAAHLRIYHVLPSLTPDTVYFVHVRHKKSNTPVAGVVRMAIVQGIGGAVTVNSNGEANSKSFNATNSEILTDFTGGWFSFRLKPIETQPAYLEIDVQNLAAGTSYCLDDIAIVAGQELYPGGPYVGAVLGVTPPLITDTWTLLATNDRAGQFQEWFDRMFDMKTKGLLLPTSGSIAIPDSLIA